MENVISSKKQYYILLVLSVITTLFLPLMCTSISFDTFSKVSASTNATVASVVSHVWIISGYVGDAVLIFSAIRYCFKLCLPFAAVVIIENIAMIIVELVGNRAYGIQIFSIAYSIINMLLYCALPFADIGITRASAKHIKKKYQ